MIQLELFPEPFEIKLSRDVESLKVKCDNLRKGQHARISSLQSKVKDLEAELAFLKAHICKENLL